MVLDRSIFRGKSVILCMGNVLKGDDGFGPLLAEALKGKVSLTVIDAGAAPENYLGALIRENPDTVIFADAADFGGEPGEAKLFRPRDADSSSFFTTHNASIELLLEFVKSGGLESDFYLLCVQPARMDFGLEPGPEVVKRAGEIADWLILNFPA